MEIKLWMVLGVLAFVMPILFWIARMGLNRIVLKLDELIKQNSDFKAELVRQNGEVNNLDGRVRVAETRLNDHSERIRNLELGT